MEVSTRRGASSTTVVSRSTSDPSAATVDSVAIGMTMPAQADDQASSPHVSKLLGRLSAVAGNMLGRSSQELHDETSESVQ